MNISNYYLLFLLWPSILATDSAPQKALAKAPVVESGVPTIEDEASVVQNLEDQGYLPSNDMEAPRELEFDLEPADQNQAEPVESQQEKWAEVPSQPESVPVDEIPVSSKHEDIEKKAARISREGQAEFIGFVDPEFVAAAQRVDQNTVQVKRAQELHFSDSRDGQSAMAMGNVVFLVVITVCSAMAMVGLVVAGVTWHRLHKQHLAAQDSEYPVYGVIGPGKERRSKKNATTKGDESMAYSAQLHHYQQTKQKIISMEQSGMQQRGHESDESDGEGEEGDYSVYECPGLAPTGDIEVSNPMFEKNKDSSNSAPSTDADKRQLD